MHLMPRAAACAVLFIAAPCFGKAPGYVTAVLAGLPDPNNKVPALNGVPGAGVHNLDVAIPIAHLLANTSIVYVIAEQNNNFTGTCAVSYELTQTIDGMKKIIDSNSLGSYQCSANQFYYTFATVSAVPDDPGPVVLTGIVQFGKKIVKHSVAMEILADDAASRRPDPLQHPRP